MPGSLAKRTIRAILHPLRGPVTWACQHGFLPSDVRKFLPWRWAIEPFTIYGQCWKCRWFPTEFDDVAKRIFWSGFREWEKETVPVMFDQIRKSRCFVDIGANSGIYSVVAAFINPQVQVIGIEPIERLYAVLVRNVSANHVGSQVTSLNIAMGTSNEIAAFHDSEDATMSSLDTSGYQGKPGQIIRVQCRTLDSIVQELRIKPDFLKIDVEGFEHAVLSGAAETLYKFRPRIVLEANPGDPSVTEVLKPYGYTFNLITDTGLERRSEIVPHEKYRNWLCIP